MKIPNVKYIKCKKCKEDFYTIMDFVKHKCVIKIKGKSIIYNRKI